MEQEPQINKIDVGAAIMGILSRVEVIGSNDLERSALLNVLKKYQNGKISAEDALKEASGVEESKQDYR